ncbi:MAG: hypothetical protein RLZZ543_311 [Bacteroidota bacterium]|jgi:hypothetical protein
MKKALLSLILTVFVLGANAQAWIFNPSQTTTKYYNASAWDLITNQSNQITYVYANNRLDYMTSKIWNGTSFVTNTSSIKIEYYYTGNNIDYTVVKFWNGSAYVQTDNSIKTEYTYNSDNQIDYTITKFWDATNSTWILGYQFISQQSIKTEYTYSGGNLAYTIGKYYDGTNWYIGDQYVYSLSNKIEYNYVGGKLDNTVLKYYDGSNWYIGFQYTYAQSYKVNHTYVGNDLSYTISQYNDGSNWFTSDATIYNWSMRTDYTIYPLAIDESVNASAASLNVYPNPSSDWFIVQGSEQLENGTLSIENSLGQTVRTLSVTGNTIKFYREDLPAGIYFLRLIQNGKSSQSKRIVISGE